ncbi:MAG: hypothetical protein J6A38_01290 [Clostridia bacterium]|nr:hypothetical protein [Clostridia bacterium]
MEKKQRKFFTAERNSRLLSIILLSVVFSAMIFIVAPFEIYCNNIEEISFSFKEFIGIQTLYATLLAILIFCILFFVPACVYQYAYPLFIGLLLMFFLQGNYLNIGLTSLAGDEMGDKISTWTYVWNTAVWVLVIAGVIVAYRLVKQRSIMQLGALILTIAITATQLMNFTVLSINTKGAYSSAIERVYGKYEDKPRFLTNKGIETVSNNRNVIVICVDRFDTVLYAEPAMQKYPEMFAELDGFTFYNDALSMYGYTFPSIGYMMSGIEYDHAEGDHIAYFHDVYNNNQTLNALHDAGYSIRLYSEAYYDYSNANDMPNYIENAVETTKDTLSATVRRPFKFGLALTKMSLYRSFPFALKKSVGGVSSDTCNEYILYTSDELQGYHAWSYDLKDAYDDIKAFDGNFTATDGKSFSFIHVSGCHYAKHDTEWNKATGKEKKDIIASARNSMELVNTYLRNMKAISPELYRDSTIVILGDHGKVGDRLARFSEPMLTAMFVKPSGASNTPLKISSAPVSHENLWPTIFESEGLAYDKTAWKQSVFEIERAYNSTGASPERKFIWTKRRKNLDSYDAIVYKINGKARDFNNWTIESETYYGHPIFAN